MWLVWATSLSAAAVFPVDLVTLRAGRHDGDIHIVLEFDGPFVHSRPKVTDGTLRLRLFGAATTVPVYRRYRSFDGWLRVAPEGADLMVTIGLPDGCGPPRLAHLETPPRILLRFTEPPRAAPIAAAERSEPDAGAPEPPVSPSSRLPPLEPVAATGDLAPPQPLVRPAEPPPVFRTVPPLDYIGDLRQMDRIRARIYSRQGRTAAALRLYRELRRRYPQDAEIWLDSVETLVEAGRFDQAEAELAALGRRHPLNLRVERLEARLYLTQRQPERAAAVFERLLSRHRDDAGLHADAGYARLDSRLWAPALNHFCRVLEVDPDNRDVRRSVHAILRAHRPRIDTDWRAYRQDAGDTRIETGTLQYRRHLEDGLRLDVTGRNIRVDRPGQAGVTAIDRSARDLVLVLRYRPSRRWQFDLGGGVYAGFGDGAGPALGFETRVWEGAHLRGDLAWRRPWYDPVAAAARQGRFDRGRLALEWAVADGLSLQVDAEQWAYRLLGPGGDDGVEYGRERTFGASLTRLVFRRPDLYVGYRFFRSSFAYADAGFTPVGMIASETVHNVHLSFEHWPCTYWGWRLYGGAQYDTARALEAWSLMPALVWRMGNRIDLEARWEHASESGAVDGGASDTIHLHGSVVF